MKDMVGRQRGARSFSDFKKRDRLGRFTAEAISVSYEAFVCALEIQPELKFDQPPAGIISP